MSPTSEAAEARTRQQREEDRIAARDQKAKDAYLHRSDHEAADVTAQERGLRRDAQDLSDAAISNALWLGGADPAQGLAGVPQDRAFAVSALLRSSERTNFTT